MKKTMKRLLATMMAVCLAATVFAGCQKGETSSTASGDSTSKTESGTASGGNKEVVTIQYYGGGANPNATYYEWQQEYFADKIGVRVEAQAADKEKLQPMLVAGNLPDIGKYAVESDVSQPIQSGHVMDLTPYEDKMPNYTKNYPQSVQFSKDKKSAGTGKLYAVIQQIGTYNAFSFDTGCYAANVRWDIYEKAGKPKVTDMYSLLDAFKKMQEVYPTTPDGLKTYAMGLYPSWDGTHMSNVGRYTNIMGVEANNIGYNFYDLANDKIDPMMEKGSSYYEALKWLNTANRMGLIDPDSMTQTYDITQAKTNESGQYFASMTGNYCDKFNTDARVNAEDPQGFMPLIWEGIHPVAVASNRIGASGGNPIFVSADTKNLDACLAFLNLMFDEDAMLVLQGGPQGELWDIKDGKYTLTDAAYEYQKTGKHTFYTGESSADWWAEWGLMSATTHSKYENATFRITDSVAFAEAKVKNNKIVDMYEEHYGVRRPAELYEKYDSIIGRPEWMGTIESKPADIADIENNVKGIVCEYSWKIVMNATSDEEVDTMFAEMQKKVNDLGMQKLVDWGKEQIEKAKSDITKYIKD